VSLTTSSASPTNASSVTYTATFSESVTSVDAADFQATGTGGIVPGAPAVSGAGNTRTITITTGGGTAVGSVTLAIKAAATITDLAGNAVAAPAATGPTVTIDKAAPTFTSMTLTPASVTAGTVSVSLTVTGAVDVGVAGVAGGEWWIGNANIAAGTGTAFAAGSGTTSDIVIPTDALAVGSYTVRVRLRDALGNWGSGASGLHTTPLQVVRMPAPTVAQAFGPTTSVSRGGITAASRTRSLTVTLTNPNAVAITGVGLTDNLPQPSSGTFNMPSTPVTTCSGGSVSRANTNRRFVLAGGTIPANGSCTITATVVLSLNAGLATGYTLTNTIAAGAVTSADANANLAATPAVLTVTP
jgi:hypothetical protein